MAGNDVESFQTQEEKRRKRIKLAAYIGAFAVFQVIVILVFGLVVMKVHTPKFRVGDNLEIQAITSDIQSSPSFNMMFLAPIRIKNTNFGPYKYDATTVNFTYGGVQVGQVTIPKSKANFKSTKKVDVTVSVNSSKPSQRDLDSGILTLNGQGKMNGKVELMLIFKKKKSTDMNCTIAINMSEKTLRSVECK